MNRESYDEGYIQGYIDGMDVVQKHPKKFGLVKE